MQDTNVKLSKEEMLLVNNSEVILTKHRIIAHVYRLFGDISETYTAVAKAYLDNNEILLHPPKIYKGEQYRQLPYVLMDYPRHFNKENIFAIRTFFWWGNFFSITLHISGLWVTKFREVILQQLQHEHEGIFIGINDDQWEHHFNTDNYLPAQSCFGDNQLLQKINAMPFLKIAARLPLNEWENSAGFLLTNFKKFTKMIGAANSQGDGRVL